MQDCAMAHARLRNKGRPLGMMLTFITMTGHQGGAGHQSGAGVSAALT